MRLGLLVVVAVGVAMLPSLSEGRIITRCEMRDIMSDFLKSTIIGSFFSRMDKEIRDCICEKIILKLEEQGGLNTSAVVLDEEEQQEQQEEEQKKEEEEQQQEEEQKEEEQEVEEEEKESNKTTVGPKNSTAEVKKPAAKSPSAAGVKATTLSPSQTAALRPRRRKRAAAAPCKNTRSCIKKILDRMDKFYDEQQEEENRAKGHERKFGLWKFSDRHHCETNRVASGNFCKTECNKFTDDDLDDDMECCRICHCWVNPLRESKLDSCKSVFNCD